MSILNKLLLFGSLLFIFVAMFLAFLSIKPDGLEPRLAFAALVGLLISIVFANLLGKVPE